MLTDEQRKGIESITRRLGGGELAIRLNIEKAEKDGFFIVDDYDACAFADPAMKYSMDLGNGFKDSDY